METRAYMEALTDDVCLSLLESHGVGRIAFVGDDALPVVVPVNYVIDGNDIVVRTDRGETYEHVPLHWVAFEVDEFEPETRVGWSVLVRGRARDVTDGLGDLYETGIWKTPTTWAPGERHQWLAIEIERISGRQIVHPNSTDENGRTTRRAEPGLASQEAFVRSDPRVDRRTT